MPIHALTSDGLDIAVLELPPEWSTPPSIEHRFPSSAQAGTSGREDRRPKAEALLMRTTVHLVLAGDEAQAFRQQLATIATAVREGTGEGWFGLPLWMDRLLGADFTDVIYSAGRLFDFTATAIVDAADTLDDAHEYASLLVGHIDDLPELPADLPAQVDFTFTLVEDSPWVFRIGINATVAAGTWPATLVPDWSAPPSEQPRHGLASGQIGLTRERTLDGQERAFHWEQSFTLGLRDRSRIRTLLAFFFASEGVRRKFTTDWWIQPGTPTDEAPASTKARFATEVLTLDYLAPDFATARVSVVQLPWEIDGVEGETPELAPRVMLYKFSYGLPTPQVYRFTNWSRTLTRSSDGDYAPAPMQHRDIPDVLDLENNRIVLDSFRFSGNPLELFHTQGQLEAPLTLTVLETETWPVDPAAAVVRFVGEVKTPRRIGRAIEAPVAFLSAILEQEIPRVRVGPTCNTFFGTVECGMDLADFTETGTFEAVDGCVLDIDTAAADAADTYALGKIEIGSGAAWETRTILASEPITGGQRLTVDWPVRQAPASQAVSFRRGCARTPAACRAYSNYPRFRGHEYVPTTNLALPQMQMQESTGKK